MPAIIPSKIDLTAGLFLNILGVPTSPSDDTFDSFLLLKQNGRDNHTLTVALKIFLMQGSTFGLPAFLRFDSDDPPTLFLIRPWQNAAWLRFQHQFKQQCLKWNDRFWLIPPAGFSKLDVKVGPRTVRPNIYCHLFVDLIAARGHAHRIIEVVNLDKQFAAAEAAREGFDHPDSGLFRSSEDFYDSLDITPRTNPSTDFAGRKHAHVNFLTIVHEIGHALGLPHIGVSHHDPLCALAMLVDDSPALSGAGRVLLAGGSNSQACAGMFASPSSAANVMGMGTQFDETNAQPWRDRIALHTMTKSTDWQVSLTKVHPKLV